MDHLSGLDATFLYMETPETPMHVGGLNIYELPPGYEGDFLEDVRRHIASRLHLAAVFQRKLVNMPFELANPVWVADDDVDLEYHIRSTVLPKPGSREQLDKLVGRLHSSLLDRSRPLWEFYVIEGLQTPADAPKGARHVAFYSKVHHAALDGMGGIALANAILDMSPVPRTVRAAPTRRAAGTDNFGIAELAASGLKNTAAQFAKLLKTAPTLARTAARALRPTAAASGKDKAARDNWFAPKTPLNVSITNQRTFAGLSIPLEAVKSVAKANEATLNDVVLAICSGALRRYLADMGCVPTQPLLAAVPVSLREAGNTDLNNQASMVRMSLASTIADPLQRLQAIRQASAAAKAMTASMKSVIPTDFPSLGAPWLISGVASLFGRSKIANRLPPIANVAISNVPGPKFALYLAGAKMLTYFPVSIAVHSMALNVTVQSYNGSLDFGLTACRKALPDLPALVAYMQEAFEELHKLSPALPSQDKAPQKTSNPSPVAAKVAAKAPRKAAAKKQGALRLVEGQVTARVPRTARARKAA
jgi:diacylglycerol O-acyltransferase / wax synthase